MSAGLIILSGKKPWFKANVTKPKAPNATKKVKIRKTRLSKKIVHQIFADACELCKDPYWISILNAMSRGKFPRNFRYSDGYLHYSLRTKSFKIILNFTDPNEALDSIIGFLRKYSGSFSKMDRMERDIKIRDEMINSQKIDTNTWISYKKIPVHNNRLVSRFIKKISDYYSLKPQEVKSLTRLICTGICSGYFNHTNIKVSEGSIVSIEPIVRNNDGTFGVVPSLIAKVTPSCNQKLYDQSIHSKKCFYQINPSFNKCYNKFINSRSK